MVKSDNELIMELLSRIAGHLPAARAALQEPFGRAEAMEVIRLNTPAVFFEALEDFLTGYEALSFISSDYQLRLKAEDIWRQQLEVFRTRMAPLAARLKERAGAEGMDLKAEIDNLINY